ncbi:MAG: hypothetical protein IKJ59_15705 [Clostridia bacterium]|nr:hypothetical protein [Clostridia bacterium]
MGDNYKHKRNGGNNSLKMIFDPYKESSYVNSDSIETFESCGIIPNCIMGYNGAIYDSQTHNIFIYKISAITAAIKYNGIYKFPTDDTNAIRYAAAFYDKNVFNHLTSVSNKEYKPTDGNKISYFVHSFGCITNLQAANNALDWLVVPRELFNSEIDNDFIYLFVCIKNKFNPQILNYIIPADTPFYWDYPVATSLYDKQLLSESNILLGAVRTLSSEINKFVVLAGNFIWNNPKEILECKSELCTVYSRTANFVDKNGIVYNNISLDIYVYSDKINNSVNAFVWCSGNEDDLVKKSYIQNYYTNEGEQISDNYNYILSSLSLNTIFNSFVALTKGSFDNYARYIIRTLACQPQGCRSISIEGNLSRLMGGALNKIAEILIGAKENKELRQEEYYQIQTLFSLNGSVMWYDSPTKLLDLRDELSLPYKIDSDKNNDKFIEQKAEMVFYLREVLGIKTGSNGCEAVKCIISSIFSKLDSYNFDIDYVFCDIETIFNDARTLNVRRFDENLENALQNDLEQKLQLSLSKRKTVRDFIYDDVIYTEILNRKNIWNELNQRGYFFDNSKFDDIKTVNLYNYGIANSNSYEHRRNINVWDAVMKNYENSLFYDYIFAPILSFPRFKDTKCSVNSKHEAKGYINRANMFETYLGGTVSVGNNMYSSIPIYEDYVSEGHKKLSMDNWKILPETLDSIYQYFVGHINRIRGTELSSGGKFNVFFSSWNLWAFELNKRMKFIQNSKIEKPNLEQESKIYYKELLFHMFLSCPDKAIAYFNIEKRRDKNNILDYIDLFENAKYNSIEDIEYIRHYYTDSFKNLSIILQEFNQITNRAKLTSLCRTLAIEPYPFVISGVTAKYGDGIEVNIWRITCDSKHGFDIIKSENPIIYINGKTISFLNGKIQCEDDNNDEIGIWVTTPNNVFPVITSDSNYYCNYNPAYHYIKNINEKTSDIATFGKYNQFTLFGELPKNHAVSLKFKIKHFNNHFAKLLYSGTLKPLEVIIGYDENTKDKQIKGVPLYFKGAGKDDNVISLNETTIYQLNLFIKLNKLNSESFKLSIDYELIDTNNDNSVLLKEHIDDISYTPKISNIQYLMATLGIISPEYSLKGSEKESFLNCFDVKEFKIYHTGFNYKTEIFRNYNGINFSRVNKYIPAYKDMPVESNVGDTYTAKISWLNALNKNIDCKLIFKVNSIQYNIDKNCIVYSNDGSIIFNNNFDSNQEVVISNNSEGYFLINLPFKASIDGNFSLSLQYNIND